VFHGPTKSREEPRDWGRALLRYGGCQSIQADPRLQISFYTTIILAYISYCVCVCMYICMYVCVNVCVCMHVCMCVYVCIYVCVRMYLLCMYVCTYVCMYVCMYVTTLDSICRLILIQKLQHGTNNVSFPDCDCIKGYELGGTCSTKGRWEMHTKCLWGRDCITCKT